MKTSDKRAEPTRRQQADDTKQRLLQAAIDVFGRHGFESSSTRMLAEAAGANLQSIAYYFGSKEGLYLAVAEYIADRIEERVSPIALAIREQIGAAPKGRLPKEQARALLLQMLTRVAHLLLHDESAPWARYMIREQMEPTAAFDHLYARVLSPSLDVVRVLVGSLLDRDPDSEQVRLRTMATLGQVLVMRAARATLMRQLSWHQVGNDELAAVDTLIATLVQSVAPATSSKADVSAPSTTRARAPGAATAARTKTRKSS